MNVVKKLNRDMETARKLDRKNTKRRFCEFTRTASVLDMRPQEERERAKRLRQAERYEARHGTGGKRSVFA